MRRPRVALWIAMALVVFGIYIGLRPYESEGWGLSYTVFTLAVLAVLYAVLDGLASSYRRRRLKR
jgi:drug/metabolite transporter (DMT)-like permease